MVAMSSGKCPFDGFGYTNEFNIVFESKLSKFYEALAFSRIEEHQILNLLKIKEVTKTQSIKTLTVITFGIYTQRQGIDLFVIDISIIDKLMKTGKKSINKKELLLLKEQNKFIKIPTSKEFDYKLLETKCIYEL